MTKVIMICLAATLAITASAQNLRKITIEDLTNKPKPHAVPLAHKAMVLQTGKLLTIAEKRDLLNKFRISAGRPARQSQASKEPQTLTITPASMVANGFVANGYGIDIWAPDTGHMLFDVGKDSHIYLAVPAAANTTYVITVKVQTFGPAQFFIANAETMATEQTVSVAGAVETEFAFAYDTAAVGQAGFRVYSSNSQWLFERAELLVQPE